MSALKTMTKLGDDALGKLAWETYSKAVGGKAFNGDALPTWEVMKNDEKKTQLVEAWIKTANAVAERVIRAIPKVAKEVVNKVKAQHATASSTFPPRVLKLSCRTKCCGADSLTLQGNRYVCPCKRTTEPA
jgi:hypothetical protein